MQSLIGNNVNETIYNVVDKSRIMFYLITPNELKYDEINEIPDFVNIGIVYFILFILIEFILAILIFGVNVYRVNDLVGSLQLGVVQQHVGIWLKPIFMSIYLYIYKNYNIIDLTPKTNLNYLLALLAIDFVYYWFHRFCHCYELPWSAHSVHHSGEDYNLATSLRQGALQQVFSLFFNIFLGLILNPVTFFTHSSLNLLYQFYIHTTILGDLGPIEYIFNTPMHHRSHHNVLKNNSNYAGVLIIWDRMFGTFKTEYEQLDYYGLYDQYETFDPIRANYEHLIRMKRKYKNNSFLQFLIQKRYTHKLLFNPFELFKPIEKPKKSRWILPKKSKRKKYNGYYENNITPIFIQFYIIFLLILNVILFLVITDSIKKNRFENNIQIILIQLFAFLFSKCIGKLCDSINDGYMINNYRLCLMLIFTFYYYYSNNIENINFYIFYILAFDIMCWLIIILTNNNNSNSIKINNNNSTKNNNNNSTKNNNNNSTKNKMEEINNNNNDSKMLKKNINKEE